MYTYTYTQMYIHTAQQGRDEPPAGQCRMGVSMGYPPLTQKFYISKKNCVVEICYSEVYIGFVY